MRYWAQTGVVGPSERAGGRAVYNFQDLVSVKAAKELLDGGLTLQRARKNLEALRAQLPQVDRPLAQLRVRSDGERVVVSDDGASFEPLTGQLVMDFDVDELQGQLAELMPPRRPRDRPGPRRPPRAPISAWAWFVEGGRCEARGDDERALIAYAKALDGDPGARRRAHQPRQPASTAAASAARRAPPTKRRSRSIPSSPRRATTSATCSTTLGERDRARAGVVPRGRRLPRVRRRALQPGASPAAATATPTRRACTCAATWRWCPTMPRAASAAGRGFDRRHQGAHNRPMPIYEYACECGARFESLERVGEVREQCGELLRQPRRRRRRTARGTSSGCSRPA